MPGAGRRSCLKGIFRRGQKEGQSSDIVVQQHILVDAGQSGTHAQPSTPADKVNIQGVDDAHDQAPSPVSKQQGSPFLAPPGAPEQRPRSHSPSPSKASNAGDGDVSLRLWDRAYDKVKVDDEVLVNAYETVLTSISSDNNGKENTIEQSDPNKRREQMSDIAEHTLQKHQKAAERQEQVQNILDVAIQIKSAVGAGFQAVPELAIPWAAIWTCADFLNTAFAESSAVREGIQHVIVSMDWYSKLPDSLQKTHTSRHHDRSSSLQQSLEDLIMDLYQALLGFLMRAVVHFATKNGMTRFIRNTVQWDDWAGALHDLKDKENFTDNKISQFQSSEAGAKMGMTNHQLERLVIHEITKEQETLMKRLHVADMEAEMLALENRKDSLLRDSYEWIFSHESHKRFKQWKTTIDIKDNLVGDDGGNDGEGTSTEGYQFLNFLWVKGDPGKGKTMLLMGIIRDFQEAMKRRVDAPNVSFFFCQKTDARFNNGTAILRSLLWTLLQLNGRLKHCLDELKTHGDSVFEGKAAFFTVKRLLEATFNDERFTPTYFVVDALDECQENLEGLLKFITESSEKYPMVKWLVSSRNESDIHDVLGQHIATAVSLELNESSVGKAVNAYIDDKLADLKNRWKNNEYANDTELESVKQAMAQDMKAKAEGTFLWVALVFQQIDMSLPPPDVLKQVQEQVPGLYGLYEDMLHRMLPAQAKVENHWTPKRKNVLLVLVNVYRPPTLSELAVLASLQSRGLTRKVVRSCGLLTISKTETVHFVHQSAKDFLTLDTDDESNSKWKPILESVFSQHYHRGHVVLVKNSLDELGKKLKRNIYGLEQQGISSQEAADSKPEPDPLESLRYSSVHWIDHVIAADSVHPRADHNLLSDDGIVRKYLQNSLLYWLESLSLIQHAPKGIVDITQLAAIIQDRDEQFRGTKSELGDLLQDAVRFTMVHRHVVETYPLQIYASALLFSPSASLIRKNFAADIPDWVIAGGDDLGAEWDAQRRVLEGHLDTVICFSLSHNSEWIATGCRDGTIKIWERSSGSCIQTISSLSHEATSGSVPITRVASVAFSHDGKQLAAAHDRLYMSVLDWRTGNVVHSFEGPLKINSTLAFSSDDRRLLMSNDDSSLTIWTLEGTKDGSIPCHYESCALSDDASLFISLRSGETRETREILFWDTRDLCITNVLNMQHHGMILDICISRDRETVAIGRIGGKVDIYSRKSGTNQRTLNVAHHSRYLCLSPDGSHLALWGWNDGIGIARVKDGRVVAHLPGSEEAKLVQFSDARQLISVSERATLSIWELELDDDELDEASEESSSGRRGTALQSVRFSEDGNRVFSFPRKTRDHGSDVDIGSWNARNGKLHASHYISSLAGDMNINRISDLQLISYPRDGNVYILNLVSGKTVCVLEGDFDFDAHAWAPLESHFLIATASYDKTLKDVVLTVWNTSDGSRLFTTKTRQTEENNFRPDIIGLEFTNDGQYLLLILEQHYQIWRLDGTCTHYDTLDYGYQLEPLPCGQAFVVTKLRGSGFEIRNIPSGALKYEVHGMQGGMRSWPSELSPDGKLIAFMLSSNGGIDVDIYSLENGRLYAELDTSALSVHSSFRLLGFDSASSVLNTNMGSVALEPRLGEEDSEYQLQLQLRFKGLGFSSNLDWVTLEGAKLLFLPLEIRPWFGRLHDEAAMCIREDTIAWGSEAGKVVILRFTVEAGDRKAADHGTTRENLHSQ